MSGPRFDLKTVVQTNAYKERILCEHKAAKAHQLHQPFGAHSAKIPSVSYHSLADVRRPTSAASSVRSFKSNSSAYTQEMDDRISRLEQTIEEERNGRRTVQKQLESLRQMIEQQCVDGNVSREFAKSVKDSGMR